MRIEFIIIAVALLLGGCLFVPAKAGYHYTRLDSAGMVLNIILAVMYIILSALALLLRYVEPSSSRPAAAVLYQIVGILGIAMPFVSALSIGGSMVLRKRGQPVWSFCVQFAALALFLFIMILIIAAEAA